MTMDPRIVAALAEHDAAITTEADEIASLATVLRDATGTQAAEIAAEISARTERIKALSNNMNAPETPPVLPPEVEPGDIPPP